MEIYVQVSFWLGVFALLCNVFVMCNANFPIQRSVSVGEKFITTMLSAGFTVWAGFLIF